jgi:two-component system, LytTR family, response regulator
MRTIIVDDERLARKELASLLEKFSNIEIIAECANAIEAKEKIELLQPDLIFLDIQMPGKSGFELLDNLEYIPEVIFVTAYDEYALKAFEVNALDYLLKPVEPNRLAEAIKRVADVKEEDRENKKDQESSVASGKLSIVDRIFIKDGERCWFVQLKDIRLFESEGNYVRIFFNNNKPLILKSLNNLEERLNEKNFFRCNRKFIVNLSFVESVEPWFSGGLKLKLSTGEVVEVSRRQAARFKDFMSL